MMNHKLKMSIYLKMVLVFLLLLLPVFTANIIINIWGAQNIRKEIAGATQNQMDSYLRNFEKEIRKIKEIQGFYISDKQFQNYSFLFDELSSIEQIQVDEGVLVKLQLLEYTSSFNKEVVLYMPFNNIQLRSGGRRDVFDRQKVTALLQQEDFPFTVNEGNFFINAYYGANSVDSGSLPGFIVSVEVSRPDIADSLGGFVQHESGAAILMGKNSDWSIEKASNKAVSEHLKNIFHGGDIADMSGSSWTISVDGEKYLTMYKESTYLDAYFAVSIPEDRILAVHNAYWKWLFILSIIIMLVITVFLFSMYHMIKKPIIRLLTAFRKVEEGDMDLSIPHKREDEFGYLYEQFNKMVKTLKMSIQQVYEQKILAKEAIMKQLQFQINPHFLYNSIYVINMMSMKEDFEGISSLTRHLGNYYKYITRGNSDEISLREEVIHAGDFIAVQNIRFSNRIRSEVAKLPEEYESLKVPRLIIQPLVENVYNHGLRDILSGGLLKVDFFSDAEMLHIRVEDNGTDTGDEQIQSLAKALSDTESEIEITGIMNVHRRLKLKYGAESGVYVSRSELGGLLAEIRITLKE